MKRFMEDPQYMPFRVAILAIIAIVLGFAVIKPMNAQNARSQTFPVGKEFPAGITACVEEDMAKQIADDEKGVEAYFIVGMCRNGGAYVTYVKRTYLSKTGFAVWEVSIRTDAGTQKAFAVTNWKAESI